MPKDTPPQSQPAAADPQSAPARAGFRVPWPFYLLIPLVLLALALLWQSLHPVDERVDEARLVYLACKYYASKNEGRLPKEMAQLVPLYLIDGGHEASLQTAAKYELLQPGGNFELAQVERRPIIRELPHPGHNDTVEILGNGEIRKVPKG